DGPAQTFRRRGVALLLVPVGEGAGGDRVAGRLVEGQVEGVGVGELSHRVATLRFVRVHDASRPASIVGGRGASASGPLHRRRGDAKARTPHLDALAKIGVRFTHAFAAVSSCSPSRSTLYTGLHTHTSGQYGLAHAGHNFHTRPAVRSLPTWLNAAGYYTGIIGKVHVIPRPVYPF